MYFWVQYLQEYLTLRRLCGHHVGRVSGKVDPYQLGVSTFVFCLANCFRHDHDGMTLHYSLAPGIEAPYLRDRTPFRSLLKLFGLVTTGLFSYLRAWSLPLHDQFRARRTSYAEMSVKSQSLLSGLTWTPVLGFCQATSLAQQGRPTNEEN